MPNYIRPKIPCATVFLTANLAHRDHTLLADHFDLLHSIALSVLESRPVTIHQWVVLPNHMHCLWTLPSNDHDFSTRVASIKAQFTMTIRRAGFSPPQNLPIVASGRHAGLKPGLRANKQTRTGNLAAPILGTSHPRPKGLRRLLHILLAQPRETWPHRQPQYLALSHLIV